MAQAKKKSAGPRPKHVPVRMCIACRRSDAKRGLIRLVRDPEGHVAIDTSGKRAGRGAYLCHDPVCWEQALKRHGLARALRIEALLPEDRLALEQFAQTLVADTAAAPANADER
jgi:predicted RNA-binding protein YlxR (DUF448 family)